MLSLLLSPTDGELEVLVAVCLYGVVIFQFRSNFQPTEEELKWVQERFKGDFVVSTFSYVQYSNAGLIHVLLPYALYMCYTATHSYMITHTRTTAIHTNINACAPQLCDVCCHL